MEKQIVDKLWDSYELTPGTAEKETVEIENLTAANKRITEVRRKISALGHADLGAIDEYARVSERYEYLTAQRDDVQHSEVRAGKHRRLHHDGNDRNFCPGICPY